MKHEFNNHDQAHSCQSSLNPVRPVFSMTGKLERRSIFIGNGQRAATVLVLSGSKGGEERLVDLSVNLWICRAGESRPLNQSACALPLPPGDAGRLVAVSARSDSRYLIKSDGGERRLLHTVRVGGCSFTDRWILPNQPLYAGSYGQMRGLLGNAFIHLCI